MKEALYVLHGMGFVWDHGKIRDGKKLRADFISNFLPVVETVSRSQDGTYEEYEIIIYIGQDHEERMTISAEEIPNIDFVKRITKCTYGCEKPVRFYQQVLNSFIRRQIADFPMEEEKIVLNQMGWNRTDEGFRYCAATAVLGGDGGDSYGVSKQMMRKFLYKETGVMDSDKVFKTCNKFLNFECSPVTIMILVMVVAVLRSFFVLAGAVPHFVVYLWGKSGSLKTTLAEYFSKFYDQRNDADKVVKNAQTVELEATLEGITRILSDVRDIGFVVDDMEPGESKASLRSKREIVAKLIRRATAEVPRSRASGNGAVGSTCNTMLIFTAEKMLTGRSSVNRMILLEIDRYEITEKVLKLMDKKSDFAKSLQTYIICWAASNERRVCEIISSEFKKSRERFRGNSRNKDFNRINESFSILRIAGTLLGECAKDFGSEIDDLEFMLDECIDKVESNEKRYVQSLVDSQEYKSVKLLYTLYNQGLLRVAPNKKAYYEAAAEYVGLFHAGFLYLKDMDFITLINKKYKSNVTINEFCNEVFDAGLLVRDKSERPRKKLDGQYLMVIDYDELKVMFQDDV